MSVTTDKDWAHNYTPIYNTIFGPTGLSGKSILEIGVYQGGSMKWWRERFNAEVVVGIDNTNYMGVQRKYGDFYYEEAYSLECIKKLSKRYPPFDYIVDDGPHTLESQKFFAANYPQLLKEGGTVIIEDMFEGHPEEVYKSLPVDMQPHTFIADTTNVGAECSGPNKVLVSQRPV